MARRPALYGRADAAVSQGPVSPDDARTIRYRRQKALRSDTGAGPAPDHSRDEAHGRMAGDGHTNIYPTRDPKIGFHVLPVKMYFFQDGLFVRSADKEHADLAGAKV